MRNEDNDCIRYLMKEMDPSEELLMERAMMEDEDLLIEVESMRQTLQKLDKLPEKDPPSYVRDAVMDKAAEQARENRKSNKSYKQPVLKFAVAATLALTVTAGGAWLFVGSDGDQQQQVASSGSKEVQTNNTAQTAGAQISNEGIQQVSAPPSSTKQKQTVKPWIDRNNILRVEDQFSDQNKQFRTILKNSTQKLKLIEHPSINSGQVNSIQLTGSNN